MRSLGEEQIPSWRSSSLLESCSFAESGLESHRAVGASTAVFAALGLLAGLAWRQRLTLRERRWYRWAPLIAGICLLTLLGAGNAHVDVLGHALGFLFGVGVGWIYARAEIPRNRGKRLQIVTGVGATLLVCAAWLLALR